jgi:16S rRNA A1518/A1519 N6-dimethyltransferase RsmA/KsgA/DIM1 with predicted DNA glycosylase/AP lyase activity
LTASARINLSNHDESPPPNISGALDKVKEKEAANQTKYESYKQSLNTWFRQRGKNSATPNIQYLKEMSKGIEDMENGFYDLIDDEFKLVNLEEFWEPFTQYRARKPL